MYTTVVLTYKFRAYPTEKQVETLEKQFDIHVRIYNTALDVLDDSEEFISEYSMHSKLTQWKRNTYPEFENVNSKAAQQTVSRIYRAISGLSVKKKKGKAVGRLRHKNTFSSIEYNQSGFSLTDTTVRLHPIGHISIEKHRDVPGEIKGVTIKQQETGDWYACFQVDVPESEPIPFKDVKADNVVGLDMNVSNLLTDSEGRQFESLWKKLEPELDRVRIEHRKLSRKEYASNNYHKQKKRLQKAYQTLHNKRNDILHKLSRWYVEKYDVIAVEKLESKRLSEGLVSKVRSQAWARFIEYLEYKASYAGVQVGLVDPAYTSQDCSSLDCTHREKKSLSERRHICPDCGLTTDRDWNAAVNVVQKLTDSLGSVGWGPSEITPWKTTTAGEVQYISLRQVIEKGSPSLKEPASTGE